MTTAPTPSRCAAAVLLAALVQVAAIAGDWTSDDGPATAVPVGVCQASAWSTTSDDGAKRAFASTSLVLGSGARLALVEQPGIDQAHGQSVAASMVRSGGVAAINGGYFTKEFTPAGLLMINGRSVTPMTGQAAFSGYFAIDADGKASLRRRGDSLADARSARQAGPFIIDGDVPASVELGRTTMSPGRP